MPLAPGQIIEGKYRVLRPIGEGGMGAVYEGENIRIGRRVAIKVLHAHVAQLPEFVERFEREARAAARVGSSFVCDVFDLGDLPSGDRFIVMEYLEGESLDQRIERRGRLTAAEIAPIAFELLDGLATMHGAGVIHRDLKPANVFLAQVNSGRGEEVRILDFGVAKIEPIGGEVGTMTQTGAMMGTPLYMSPEQARGARDVDARTDIYAASIIFYRALTGQLPYDAASLNELLFKIVLEDPPLIRDVVADVDEAFAAIVHRGMVRDPELRLPTARAYQELVAAWGRAQGRTSLHFTIRTPSQQDFPAASRTATPSTSDGPAKADRKPRTNPTPAGTPIVWSEDRPKPVMLNETRAMPDAPPIAPPPMPAAAAAAPKRSLFPVWIGGASLIAAVGVFAVLKARDTTKPSAAAAEPAQPQAPASAPLNGAAEEPKLAAPQDNGVPLAPSAAAAAAAGNAPSPAVPAATGARRLADPSRPATNGEPPLAVTAATSSPAATTAAPSASAHGRKFRTNID